MEADNLHNGLPRRHPRGQPIPNWCSLRRSDEVEVCRDGFPIAAGQIDMLALDGSMVWILKEHGNDRALFLHSDGVTLHRRPVKRPL